MSTKQKRKPWTPIMRKLLVAHAMLGIIAADLLKQGFSETMTPAMRRYVMAFDRVDRLRRQLQAAADKVRARKRG